MEAAPEQDQLYSALVLLRAVSSTSQDLMQQASDSDATLASLLAELNILLDERLSRRS